MDGALQRGGLRASPAAASGEEAPRGDDDRQGGETGRHREPRTGAGFRGTGGVSRLKQARGEPDGSRRLPWLLSLGHPRRPQVEPVHPLRVELRIQLGQGFVAPAMAGHEHDLMLARQALEQ